ncbi:DoxX family protein [Burkholderia sp. WSM2232]|uniref:DoxX family protein n=1 Tax=Burkholderia sp. WSM2232 TaxID=944436 RepID=UPI00068435B1|nr:DoxX family protein [Burkholderia sp. WSM2232]
MLGGLEREQVNSPTWVEILLRQPWVMPLVRVCLVSAYLIGGVSKLLHFDAAVAEQVHFGLNPGWLWAGLAIFVEIAGSLCVVFNRLTWLGAGALAVLTLVAMLVANNFWVLEGAARFMALNSFFEHLGLIAAFVMVTYLACAGRRSRVLKEERQSHYHA